MAKKTAKKTATKRAPAEVAASPEGAPVKKRRGRPPGSKTKPKPGVVVAKPAAPAAEPAKRRGRPPKAKPPEPAAATPPKSRRGRPPKAKPPEAAAASVAPPPPAIPPAPPQAPEPVSICVGVDASERRILVRVRGDLYARLTRLCEVQNGQHAADERLEIAEQAGLCIETGLAVWESERAKANGPDQCPVDDAEYSDALSSAMSGRTVPAVES